jgi:hypothetical protein
MQTHSQIVWTRITCSLSLLFGKSQAVIWEGKDNGGVPVSSGIYFAKLVTASSNEIVKVVLLR